ncbi:uncharacterized protein LOC144141736 [Haemaphysalis longicornis]
MLRSFCLQARICRLCGCLFIKDIFSKPPKSPKLVWMHWYTLYAAMCFSFFLWFETDVVIRHAINLSDTHRLFTKCLLVLLHVVVILKACGNFASMILGGRQILEFFEKADAFEKKIGIPSCLCCIQKGFFLTDIAGLVTFGAYFISYTAALFHQEQKLDNDGRLSETDIAFRACSLLAGILFYAYDGLNFAALRHSAQVLESYVKFLKGRIDDCVGRKVVGCEQEAALKVQTMRLQLCTVLELKNAANAIWDKSVVLSSTGLVLVTCISLYTVITEGVRRTELWIAIGYSAFSCFEFFQLARVSQSLSNAFQALKHSCRKTPTVDVTPAYSQQVEYLHNTINPDDICLSGSDFFKINLALLGTMAGTVITYTVILVQTSPDLSDPPSACECATTATAALAI